MSLTLFTAMTGLLNQQTKLDVLSNNIANMQTTGFKGSRVTFRDHISLTLHGASAPTGKLGGINPQQVGQGMRLSSIDTLMSQGSIQFTGNPMDLAIEGDGFFILKQDQQTLFTRDGALQIDENGNLMHGASRLKVQGFQADEQGNIKPAAVVTDLTIPVGLTLDANATETASIAGNLDARVAVGGSFTNSFVVFDSLGTPQPVSVTFTKTANNKWDWLATNGVSPAGNGTLTFGPDGSSNIATGYFSMTMANGSETPLIITPEFTSIAQLAETSALHLVSQDGFPPGTFEGFEVDHQGAIRGVFTNGQTRLLGKVALARFVNTYGLRHDGSNLFAETATSGRAQMGAPSGGVIPGSVQAGALEMANVNLADQMTQVLLTQRSFQAAARVLSTGDEMLQDVIALRR